MSLASSQSQYITMKLSGVIIPLFAATSLTAAKYPAGTICHTNVECNQHCINSKWTVTRMQDDYNLVCDPNTKDPAEYFAARCQERDPLNHGYSTGSTPGSEREDSTKLACEAIDGKLCGGYSCRFDSKRSTEDDWRSKWEKACSDRGVGSAIFVVFLNETESNRGC
jgi:hypothetical protein